MIVCKHLGPYNLKFLGTLFPQVEITVTHREKNLSFSFSPVPGTERKQGASVSHENLELHSDCIISYVILNQSTPHFSKSYLRRFGGHTNETKHVKLLMQNIKKETKPSMECGKASYSCYIIEHWGVVLKS